MHDLYEALTSPPPDIPQARMSQQHAPAMPRTRPRANPHPIAARTPRTPPPEAGAKSEGQVTVTGLEPRTT